MNKDIQDVEIRLYEPKFAKGIATMWNSSEEAWNGRTFNYDEAKIVKEEEKSASLATYIAVKDGEVIGYADLHPKQHGLAMIGMLNVLPRCHGTGVGKLLVQRCIVKAIELGFSGISLFTWAGNTKAVPLYKKCGFFWQKMEANCTYLINFLPGVLSSELLKPYFEYFDWYKDLHQELKVEPDGEERDGFEYYSYLWKKGDQMLRVVFDRFSHAIVEIECKDFHLESKVFDPKPVFGTKAKIFYNFQAFNPQYQELEIKSLPEHNIDFEYYHKGIAREKLELHAEFSLLPIQRKFTEWEARASVRSEVSIGRRSIKLGISQNVQYPIELSMRTQSLLMADTLQLMYLNLNNNLDEKVQLILKFPEDNIVHMEDRTLHANLAPKEKQVLQTPFKVSGSTLYTPSVLAECKIGEAEAFSFELKPDVILTTHRGTDSKRAIDKTLLLAATSYLWLTMRDQKNWGYLISKSSNQLYMRPTDFGRPFNNEFDNEDAVDIQMSRSNDFAQMEVFYESKLHPGLKFSKVYTLYCSGELQLYLNFQNIPKETESLCLKESFGCNLEGFTFAKGEELICLPDGMEDIDISDFDPQQISERWLYFKKDHYGTGILWEEGWKLCLDAWWLCFEIDLAKLKAMPNLRTPMIKVYPSCFFSAYQFREFAMCKDFNKIPKRKSCDIVLNNHNPLHLGSAKIVVNYHGRPEQVPNLVIPSLNLSLIAEAKSVVDVPLSTAPLTVLDAKLSYPNFEVEHSRLLLHKAEGIDVIEDSERITIDNGVIRYSAMKQSTLPTVYSLGYKDIEWLDQVPQGFVPRAFFNPYSGGIITVPSNVKLNHLIKDTHKLEHAVLKDQHANLWEGLCWESTISQYAPLKGLIYRQYYLTAPGLPILLHSVEILESLNKANYLAFCMKTHLHTENIMPQLKLTYPNSSNVWQSYKSSKKQYRRGGVGCIYKIYAQDTILHAMSLNNRNFSMNQNSEYYCLTDYSYSSLNPQKGEIIPPIMMIFSVDELDCEMAQNLLNLHLTRC